MKKTAILIPALLISLTGCNWLGTPKTDFDRAGYPYRHEVTGIVQSESWEPGMLYTHLLTDELGQTKIFMKSSELNLNKYKGEEVTAKGKVDLATDNITEVLLVDEIEIIQEEVEQKTFSAGSLDFSVDYPSNLEPRKLINGVKFYDDEGEVVFRITELESISDDLNENITELAPKSEFETTDTHITVQKAEALRRTEIINGTPVISVYLLGDTNFYQLEFFNPNPARQDHWEDVFAAMLESFTAEDLTSIQAQGKFCGGGLNEPCPGELICLLEGAYPDAGGTCVTAKTYNRDAATIREACNNTEGFLNELDIECPANLNCAVLPQCECSGSRVWDEIAGCVSADSVAPATDEPTAIEPAPLGPDVSDKPTDTEPTDTEPTDTEPEPEAEAEPEPEPEAEPTDTEPEADETSVTTDTDDITPSSEITGETRHMESHPTWGFALEYPKNWYYISLGNGGYVFSPNEAPETHPAVTVTKVVNCTQYTDVICEIVDGTHFLVEYKDSYLTEAEAMAETITLTD